MTSTKESIILDNKLDHILLQNKNLKEQIKIICKRIEENIHSNKSTAKVNDNVTADISVNGEDYMPIYQQINKYKEHVAKMKAKMEGLYNLKKLESTENEIKEKQEITHNLKYENNVLNNIQKNQMKALVQFEQKYENKNEVKMLQEKLRTLKEEFKYSKDSQKSLEAKIKTQNSLILGLEEKCSKIKENIEFKKRSNTGQNKNVNSETYLNPEEDDVTYLEEKAKYLELQVSNEEKNYKNEIGRQQAIISKLSEEHSLISMQLKEKEQEIRINELKLKELNKINKHNTEKNILIRHKSNEGGRVLSAKDQNNPIHNRSKSKPLMSRTPNNLRNNKPFDIKFNNVNINNKRISTNYIDKGARKPNLPLIFSDTAKRSETKSYKEKDDMLNQIENLKNELKSALKYNEKLFKKELDNDNFLNDNQIFSHQYNHKEQSSLISNKELFEKIDQSMINYQEKEKEKDIRTDNIENNIYYTENKRKPFKPFAFEK